MRQNDSISFKDQLGNVHSGLVRYPEELHFADSVRCPIDVRLYDSLLQPGDSNESIFLTVKEYGTQYGYSETRVRDKNGWAHFDIARYVQMILGDPDADGVFDYSYNSELVSQKLIQVTLKAFDTTFFTDIFNAVHGNNRVTDRWWASNRTIRWWPAYPFAFDFPNVAEVTKKTGDAISTVSFPQVKSSLDYTRVRVKASVFGNGTFTIESIKEGIAFGIAQSTDTGHVAGTKLFIVAENAATLIADTCLADINAAYLRWIDSHCELRHWLFMRHSETDTVTIVTDRRSGYDPDRFIDGVAQDGRMRDGTLAKELTVNTGMLQGWEYEIASSIINAPFVDMLDMDEYINHGNTLWHRLTVKDGTYTKQLRNRHASDQDLKVVVTLQYDGERSIGV